MRSVHVPTPGPAKPERRRREDRDRRSRTPLIPRDAGLLRGPHRTLLVRVVRTQGRPLGQPRRCRCAFRVGESEHIHLYAFLVPLSFHPIQIFTPSKIPSSFD